ncbi:hypothetical protein [Phycicoccus sp. HDW14]|uniref:hypothetical protein n=1 Tax=Phycicoccus sp. HDW14 TaxID=2714941 RepID=UPI001F0F9FBF|nr:hypothetical protein [Phycicoccus sp. HDW14]
MDVHGVARRAGQAEERHAVATGVEQQVHRELAAVELGRQRERTVDVRDDGDDRHEVQAGVLAQRLAEVPADLLRPQVLVLEVDEPACRPDGLVVAERDAALTVRGEVEAVAEQRGVGAHHLHGLAGTLRRRRGRRLLGQRLRVEVLPLHEARGEAPRVARQRGGVVPALAEGRLEVVDGRALHRALDVVPRGRRSEDLRHGDDLGVAAVLLRVTTAVAEVDPADVGDVARRVVAVADDDELLVVRPTRRHPHVAQALAARLVDEPRQLPGLLGVEAEPTPVRAPQQAADHDAPAGRRREDGAHRLRRVVGQPLVGVAPPVGEEHEVAGAGGLERRVQLGEVRGAVHERAHGVARTPRDTRGVPGVDAGVRVRALLGEEEEVGEHRGHPAGPGRRAGPPIPG